MIAFRSGVVLGAALFIAGCVASPGPTINGVPQTRVVRSATFRMPAPVSPNNVRALVPAVDSKSTCRILDGVPQPGVARMMLLTFDSTEAGHRSISVGFAADGGLASYSDTRGDVSASSRSTKKSGYRQTAMSINFAEQRTMLTNWRGSRMENFMVLGPAAYSAPSLGNPNAMIERAKAECASAVPQSVVLSGLQRTSISNDHVRRLSSNVSEFTPLFPAIETSPICIDLEGPMRPGVAKTIMVRFRTNGIPQRAVSVDVDAQGKPLRYQDNRSENLTLGGPLGSANTSIFIDFVKRTAQLTNVDGKGGLEIADVDMSKALDADNLGVPILMMERARKRCELP